MIKQFVQQTPLFTIGLLCTAESWHITAEQMGGLC